MFRTLRELQRYAWDHDLRELKQLLDQAVDLAMLEVANVPGPEEASDLNRPH